MFANEIQPKNNKDNTRKRIDQNSFNPFSLELLMPKYHCQIQMQCELLWR